MNYFEELKIKYVTERKLYIKKEITTLGGLYYRLVGSKKYFARVLEAEQRSATLSVQQLRGSLDKGEVSREDAKIYKAALKNANAKLKERSDFLVIMVGLVSLYGLTSFSDKPLFSFISPAPFYFVAAIFALITVVAIERVNMLAETAGNEEVTNVIDAAL